MSGRCEEHHDRFPTLERESDVLLLFQHFLYRFVLFGIEIDKIDEVYVSFEPTDDHSSGTSSFCWFP